MVKPAAILITDFGFDIDDTLALSILVGALDVVNVVAIVSSLNRTLQRSKLIRQYLNHLGCQDSGIEILSGNEAEITCKSDGKPFDVYDMFTQEMNTCILPSSNNTPNRILEICKEHERDGLVIIGIGALTPLKDAIELDKQKIASGQRSILKRVVKALYLQGHVYFSDSCVDPSMLRSQDLKTISTLPTKNSQFIIPAFDAFNYHVDLSAATSVFNYFQHIVPITTMGRYAAYEVKIKKKDLIAWSKILEDISESYASDLEDGNLNGERSSCGEPVSGSFYEICKSGLVSLRKGKLESFAKAHPLAPLDQSIDLNEWFDKQDETYGMAAAFDPLLISIVLDDISSTDNAYYRKDKFRVCLKDGGVITHYTVGNSPNISSIINPEALYNKLCTQISNGILSNQSSL